MRIEVGQILVTNYDCFGGTEYKRVVSIKRGCTCKAPLDFFDEGPDMPPHLHMRLRYTVDAPEHLRGSECWLGWYDEQTLESVIPGKKDKLILCKSDQPVQSSLKFA